MRFEREFINHSDKFIIIVVCGTPRWKPDMRLQVWWNWWGLHGNWHGFPNTDVRKEVGMIFMDELSITDFNVEVGARYFRLICSGKY